MNIESLKSENLKLKFENESLKEQIQTQKNTIFRKDLFNLIDELEIRITDIDNEDFMDILRYYYDKGGIDLMRINLKKLLKIEDKPEPESTFDMPPDLIKYMEKLQKR